MKVLAIEGSAAELSVALFHGESRILSRSQTALQRQSESLAPLAANTLAEAGWNASELGCVAVSLGPGSFSGLRSSLAFAKGLCFANRATLLGIPTLDAWAEQAALPDVEVWLDARKGQVYRGRFRDGRAVDSALIDRSQALLELPQGMAVVGERGSLSAESVGRLALRRLALSEKDEAASLEPIYLRRPEAELLWEKLHPGTARPAGGADAA